MEGLVHDCERDCVLEHGRTPQQGGPEKRERKPSPPRIRAKHRLAQDAREQAELSRPHAETVRDLVALVEQEIERAPAVVPEVVELRDQRAVAAIELETAHALRKDVREHELVPGTLRDKASFLRHPIVKGGLGHRLQHPGH